MLVVDRLIIVTEANLLFFKNSRAMQYIYGLLGAKIGKRCFMSLLSLGFGIDMFAAGEDCWFGSGSVAFPAEQCENGDILLRRITVGNGVLLAERCVLSPGSTIGNYCTVGSLTLVPSNQVFRGFSTHVGSPAIQIDCTITRPESTPKKQQSHFELLGGRNTYFDKKKSEINEEGKGDIFTTAIELRLLVLKFCALFIEIGFICCYTATWTRVSLSSGIMSASLMVFLLYMTFGGSFLLVFRFTKHVFVKFEGNHPLFGRHMVGWQLIGYLQYLVDKFVGTWVRGTAMMQWYMRALGGKVGAGVFWAASVPTEIDIFTVGERVVVEEGATVVGHVVDHGQIQHRPTIIGADAYIGAGSHVQPGVYLGSGAQLLPLTLAMKSECMPSGTAWQGSPAEATPALAATNAIREWSVRHLAWLQQTGYDPEVASSWRLARRNPLLALTYIPYDYNDQNIGPVKDSNFKETIINPLHQQQQKFDVRGGPFTYLASATGVSGQREAGPENAEDREISDSPPGVSGEFNLGANVYENYYMEEEDYDMGVEYDEEDGEIFYSSYIEMIPPIGNPGTGGT